MKTLHGIAVVIWMCTLVGCSLDPVKRSGNITIRIEAPKRSVSSALTASIMTAPTSVSAFSCIGVNVIGPGIPDTSRNPDPNLPLVFDRLLRRESYCSYRGIIKGPLSTAITTDQEISLVVPPGAPRLVQVIGIIEKNGSNDCQAEFIPGVLPPLDGNGHPLEGDAYELGRAVVDLFQDQTVSIAMDYDSLATDADRAVRELKCGNNAPPATTILSPTVLSMPATPVTHIATGANHICGIFGGSNTVYCRGANTMGQLGDGTTTNSSAWVPTAVTGASKVAAGNGFSCALVGSTMKCWGAGTLGQLGNNANANSTTPVVVTGGLSFSEISAGNSHACGITVGGVYCWGAGGSGQLGNGSSANSSTPVQALTGSTNSLISLGASHSCAKDGSGYAQCWGLNSSGQLGNGNTINQLSPVAVTGAISPDYFSAGGNQTCSIDTSNNLKCWGSNNLGQLGDGTTTDRTAPTLISSVPGALTVTTGNGFSCSNDSTDLFCWGTGPQRGIGTTTGSPTPGGVSLATSVSETYPSSVSATVCVKLSDGTVYCWGDNQFGQIAP